MLRKIDFLYFYIFIMATMNFKFWNFHVNNSEKKTAITYFLSALSQTPNPPPKKKKIDVKEN